MNSPTLIGIAVLATCLPSAADEAPDGAWPGWRGPGADGSTAEGTYPAEFSPTKNVEWKVKLPGKGCSTPIVWGNRIVVTAPVNGQDAALCFDSDGKELWRTTLGKETGGKRGNSSGANPSGATDGKFVFAYFKSGTLAGLDLEKGKLLWQTNLQKRFGEFKLYWDLGTSPVLTEKHVVVAAMHAGESYLAAFEKETGNLAWRELRNYKTPVEGDHSYATPIVYERGGKQTILVWGADHLTAHDAADGKVIWSCGDFNPEKQRNWVTVGSAVIVGQTAVVSYGRGSRLRGVTMGGKGDVTGTHKAWDRKKLGSFVPTPAASGGRVYVLRDQGILACVDAKTGRTAWEERLPPGKGKFYSSPTIAGDTLYAAREHGAVVAVSIAGGAFKLLAENDMGEQIIASPVPVAGRLLIRGEKHLYSIRVD